uniref:Trafficking protein particle complex subunit n=1 Tax=Steinernema glaseri TaxID=37863 RepID=A0A1I7YEK8_9BILA
MSIYDVFIINRAGSLIYDYSTKAEIQKIEKTFSYPLNLVLEHIDQKAVVVFGKDDRIQLRYSVSAINGRPVRQCRFTTVDENGTETEHNAMEYLSNAENFPMDLTFSPPTVTQNEKIILSSTFHSLFAIAAQLSPMPKSSGIEVLETNQFRLHCFQSVTGVKFIVVAALNASQNLDALLRKIYELYADFALKNPFYSIDMPIRCERFDEAMVALVSKADSGTPVLNV